MLGCFHPSRPGNDAERLLRTLPRLTGLKKLTLHGHRLSEVSKERLTTGDVALDEGWRDGAPITTVVLGRKRNSSLVFCGGPGQFFL